MSLTRRVCCRIARPSLVSPDLRVEDSRVTLKAEILADPVVVTEVGASKAVTRAVPEVVAALEAAVVRSMLPTYVPFHNSTKYMR